MELFTSLTVVDTTQAVVATLAAAITIHFLTYLAIPTSTSQAIIGAIFALGLLAGTSDLNKLIKVMVCWITTPIVAAILSMLLYFMLSWVVNRYLQNIQRFDRFVGLGIIIAGCYGAYALGANNVANVTGVYYASGMLNATSASIMGALAIGIGAATYSRKVIETVGRDITELSPFSAMVALSAEAFTIHLFTFLQVPVSSSQAVVGAVVGIGLFKGMQAVSYRTLRIIAIGWIMTPLSAGLLAVGIYLGHQHWHTWLHG